MEENILTDPPSSSVCSHCQIRSIDTQYLSPLCEECRQTFIRFPIPNWIKLFGAGVALVLCFALIRLPTQLSTGVHLEKGKNAINEHRFKTAHKELKLALNNKVPAYGSFHSICSITLQALSVFTASIGEYIAIQSDNIFWRWKTSTKNIKPILSL